MNSISLQGVSRVSETPDQTRKAEDHPGGVVWVPPETWSLVTTVTVAGTAAPADRGVESETSDMTFWDAFWLMVWSFLFICYLMVVFQVIADIFRDRTMKGWGRALWLIALLIAPPLTALIYVIARGSGMAERQRAAVRESQAATDDYIRSVAGATDPADQIARAKRLLDAGAITPPEFEQLKANALA